MSSLVILECDYGFDKLGHMMPEFDRSIILRLGARRRRCAEPFGVALVTTSVGFFWENYGPMHHDRCEAVANHLPDLDVIAVQQNDRSVIYGWLPAKGRVDVQTLVGASASPLSRVALPFRLFWALKKCSAVFLCHYEKSHVLLAAIMLRLSGHAVYAMMDSKIDDFQRFAWREFLKTFWLLPYNGVMSASRRSANFAIFLGVPRRRVLLGYDTLSLARIRKLAGAVGSSVPAHAERYFMVVARFVRKKNLETTLRAFARYVELDPSPRRLRMFGGGELEASLRALAEHLGISAFVDFHGFEQAEEICKALSGSLALLLLSLEEQFGLAVIEAQALGIPVIISDRCGVRDEFVRTGVNGIVVEPDNIEAVARGMADLASSESTWLRMSAASSQFVQNADAKSFSDAVKVFLESEGRGLKLAPHFAYLVPQNWE